MWQDIHYYGLGVDGLQCLGVPQGSKGPAAALRIGALANTPKKFNLETLKYEKLRVKRIKKNSSRTAPQQ